MRARNPFRSRLSALCGNPPGSPRSCSNPCISCHPQTHPPSPLRSSGPSRESLGHPDPSLCRSQAPLCRACVGKEEDSRSRLGGAGRVTGSRSALTSVAALLYRPVTLEGENLELILRAKDRAFSLAADREVREKARLGRNMLPSRHAPWSHPEPSFSSSSLLAPS